MPRSSPMRRVAEPLEADASPRESFAGEVVETPTEGVVSIRRRGEVGPVLSARLGVLPGYRATVGDVVVVSWLGQEAVVLGVLEATSIATLVLPDGATARVVEGRFELADPEGRLLVRYVDGTAEIAPVAGDLRLSAPAGRVHIQAGLDVTIEANRDVTVTAQRASETRIAPRDGDADLATRLRLDSKGATVAAPTIEMRTRRARLTAGVAEAVAREIRVGATRIETTATELETHAERIVTKAQSVVQEVAELLETRAGRVRSIVKGVFSLRSRKTTLKSKEDTAIDGRHVLLG